ncbi:MAG: GNAT family N-acetyltransferase [Burkholderiaceae bacterium]|nr:GNAT family N-acetyltransferase [Burkholderiaceae bacterium]
MLADNAYSLAEAAYNTGYQVRAIYLDDTVVGFMMWVPESSSRCSIWRFMVGAPHQGRGIGSAALELAIAEIRAQPGLRELEICYHPGNEASRRLYARHGFIEQGLDADGDDMLAVLPL